MSAEFLATLGDVSNLPGFFNGIFLRGNRLPRLAFVGRSNVGKSSLINALVSARVAQVSKEPGKTRAIHFYVWNEGKKVVADLPGYGYARTGHSERERWSHFINSYFKHDQNLEQSLVLLDARHGPTELDAQAIGFLSSRGIPVTFVMTKMDQLKTQSERARRKKEVPLALEELGFSAPRVIWVSTTSRDGLKELEREILTSVSPEEAS